MGKKYRKSGRDMVLSEEERGETNILHDRMTKRVGEREGGGGEERKGESEGRRNGGEPLFGKQSIDLKT